MTQWRGIPSVPPTDATSQIFLQSIKENLENVIYLLDPTKYGRAQNTAYLNNDITNLQISITGVSASVTNEATVRADADEALAEQIQQLIVSGSSAVMTYAQSTAPTTPNLGDIWFDTDDDNRVHRYSGSAWVPVDDLRTIANTSAISNEQTVRLNADNALASSITSLTSLVNTSDATLQANINSEASTRATADSALSSSITSLTSTVNGNTSSITTLQTTTATQTGQITNLNAQYGVTVSAGKVTGFKLNSSATTSDFIVQADKFQIENSTGVPFKVVGSDVYINDNKVQTASIINNSVTVPATAYTAANFVVPYNIQTEIQTYTFAATGAPILVTASFTLFCSVSGTAVLLTVYRDSTAVYGSAFASGAASGTQISLAVLDTPAAGTYVYTIKLRSLNSANTVSTSFRNLTLLEAKR